MTEEGTQMNTTDIMINEKDIEEKIKKLIRHDFVPKNITYRYRNLSTDKQLIATNAYEGSAQAIYDQGIRLFGFDKEKAKYFKQLQILYAKLVTPAPEYYSVWFAPHSNINNSTNDRWYNFFDGDIFYQCEVNNSSPTHNKPRITFIKQENGDYVFVGIFQFAKDHSWYSGEQRYYVQVYTKVGDTYPNKQ